MGSGRRRLLLSFAIVIAAAVAGAVAGLLLVGDEEEEGVRDAAEALIPPGATVEERIEGRPGENFGPLFDYRGPYRVTIRGTEADDPYTDRVERNDARAVEQGWQERERETFPNGIEIVYEQDGLELRLTVRQSSPVWRVRVEEDAGAERRAMLTGATIGVALAAGVLLVVARRRGDRTQSDATPTPPGGQTQ